MTNDIATTKANYVERYVDPAADPYAAFAKEAGSLITGQNRSACKQGVWGIGRDEDPVP